VKALEQWRQIESGLDPNWDDARFAFVVDDQEGIGDAAAVLAPLGPGRYGRELRFQVSRRGAGPERLANLLRRLDRKRIWGTLTLVDAQAAPAPEPEEAEPAAAFVEAGAPVASLAEAWDAEVARLPPDWRDVLAALEFESTDYLAQAALLGAPLNPTRVPGEIKLRFRVNSRGAGGYGAPSGLVRRCLERMDAAGVKGRLGVVSAISGTDNVATQGIVWRLAGRAV
jgi:hypothetical protein